MGKTTRERFESIIYAMSTVLPHNSTLTAFITLFGFALIMSPLEMVLHSYRLLEPWLFVAFQAYKSLFATIFPIIEIVQYTTTDWSTVSSWLKLLTELMIAVTICMAVSFYAALVYGSVVFHRERMSGRYDRRYDAVREKAGEDSDSLRSGRPSTSGSPIMSSGALAE
jgi:hypothetical protein